MARRPLEAVTADLDSEHGVWGAALLGECVVRTVGAYTVPVETTVWLGTVITVATMVFAFMVSGRVGAVPMARMIAQAVPAERTADAAR
ncbi:hypothetical protein [Streptomyces atratus]|uniref:hypothetical protein n=1 Tax=Streptomyces atratus TaxID=1893 RepID=UPI0033C46E9F